METSTIAVVLSCVATVVGIFNLAATSAKLKLDLYNRRFKVYEDVLALYQVLYNDWDDKKVDGLERAMIRSFRESKFIFDPKDGVYDVILQIKDANAKNSSYYKALQESPNNKETLEILAKHAVEGRMAFDALILKLEDKLAQYLDFRKINGWV